MHRLQLMSSTLVAGMGFLLCLDLGLAQPQPFSPDPAPRLKVLMDYYHHVKPRTRIGEHIVSGAWATNVGRYGFNDFGHTNSFDPLFRALKWDFALHLHDQPFTAEALEDADVVWIFNPDTRELVKDIPIISDEEIDALDKFVRAGGSMVVMVNSGGHDSEKFESVQLRKLMHRFGLDWNDDDTRYSDIDVGPRHPYFYDINILHYGAGCTIDILDNAEDPHTLLWAYKNKGYEEENVEGPGIVLVHPGKGKVLFIGDTGSWGANMSRPWAQNERALMQLFYYLRPDNGVNPPRYSAGDVHEYDVTVTQISSIPTKNSLNSIPQPGYQIHQPRPKTKVPYMETTGEARLACVGQEDAGVRKFNVTISGFQTLEEAYPASATNEISFTMSRQGQVSQVVAEGNKARWLSPDIGNLIGFVPNNGIRVGDHWKKVEALRILPVQGLDLAKTKPVETDVVYVGDVRMNGRDTRHLRTSTVFWLSDERVRVEDLLPHEFVRQWGGTHWRFFGKKGGRLLLRRDQWIDKETGVVVKAKSQSRIAFWGHDTREDLEEVAKNNAVIDNNMVTAISHTVEFVRK